MNRTPSNPFTGARVRPGEIDFLFPPGWSVGTLVERLEHSRWRGQIIGPHGSGKSTLIAALLPHLQDQAAITFGAFQGGRERWSHWKSTGLCSAARHSRRAGAPRRIVVIDGFEQLSPIARAIWKLRCRVVRQGLIVTAHRSVGLPDLWRTSVSADLAHEIVGRIAGACAEAISPGEIDAALHAAGGNMRDALFALYDAYERRRDREPAL